MLLIYGLFTNTPANQEKITYLPTICLFKMVITSSMIKWPQ